MRKAKKKILGLILVTSLVLTTLSGCAPKSTAAAGSKILYCTFDLTDTFRGMLAQEAVKAGKNNGVTVDIYEGEPTISDQVDKIKKAKSEGYGAIIIRPAEASAALQLELAAGDLPMVFVNSQPDDSVLKKDRFVFAGSMETEAGELQAEWAIKTLKNKSPINVVIMKGEKGHSATVGRTRAIKYTFDDAGIEAHYVFTDYGDWLYDLSAKKIKAFLRTGQDYDIIMCNNDTIALGVISALEEAGVDPKSIPICGVDATADGCAAIEAGDMDFTVMQNSEGQSTAAVKAALNMMSGKSVTSLEGATADGKYVLVPFESVDASYVSNYD